MNRRHYAILVGRPSGVRIDVHGSPRKFGAGRQSAEMLRIEVQS